MPQRYPQKWVNSRVTRRGFSRKKQGILSGRIRSGERWTSSPEGGNTIGVYRLSRTQATYPSPQKRAKSAPLQGEVSCEGGIEAETDLL